MFLDEDFLLTNATACRLYHEFASGLPIIDFHSHVSPYEIAQNKAFSTITELWLGADHYKWRAMRACGVPERLITGSAEPYEKFEAWASTLPMLIGNPLYHWTHLELQRYFGINEPLSGKSARAIYDACNKKLQEPGLRSRGIIQQSNVQALCTTDDPLDPLDAHAALAAEGLPFSVLPTFRPDRALHIQKPGFAAYLGRLGAACGFPIASMAALQRALSLQLDRFAALGCRMSDHGVDFPAYAEATQAELDAILQGALAGRQPAEREAAAFTTALLLFLAGEYKRCNIGMQLHFGCLRNPSDTMLARLGPDTGYDSMGDAGSAASLARLLNAMERVDALPRLMLFPLNPADTPAVTSVMGAFQTNSGSLQHGPAWWFNDHKPGIERQLVELAGQGALGRFVGMATDSRSFVSYARHEYFRRILCNLIGGWVEAGEYPDDFEALHALVAGICYGNVKAYLGI